MPNSERITSDFTWPTLIAMGLITLSASSSASALFESGIPSDWSCRGTCDALGANGDISEAPSPGGGNYGFVTTEGGVNEVALPGVGSFGSSGSGSLLTSTPFSANRGDTLRFTFNYVTTDTNVFQNPPPVTDYAWTRLLGPESSGIGFLFTARTNPQGNTVPGFGLPRPDAMLNPPSSGTLGGAPFWAPLGDDSGTCVPGAIDVCGYTDWINSEFTIPAAGEYRVEFGVTNVADDLRNSGLAFDGMTLDPGGGEPPPEPPPTASVPEPWSLGLLLTGLAGIVSRRCRFPR